MEVDDVEEEVETEQFFSEEAKIEPKLGQLLAALHVSLVQKGARIFIQNEDKPGQLETKGLYLNKLSAPFLVQMTMPLVEVGGAVPPDSGAEYMVPGSAASTLCPGTICAALQELVGIGNTRCDLGQDEFVPTHKF